MGYWPESTKQLRNKRVISLSVVCVLLFCSFQLISDRDKPRVNSRIDMKYFSSPPTSQLHDRPVEKNYLDVELTMNDNLTLAMINKLGNDSSSDINENSRTQLDENSSNSSDQSSRVAEDEKAETGHECDIYSGKWVRDDSYPLYPAGECPYISGEFNCKENGRLDSDFVKWRWQPRDCDIPRFNATDMLERLRGKRLMFVGDSINRNQWESMLCILRTAVPETRISFSSKGAITAFLVQDYNCSVEFFWAPFLIEQGNAIVRNITKQILLLDRIEKHGNYWKDVDILVFNSAHWWTHGNKVSSRDFYQEGNYLYPELEPMAAFKKGLTTWANWIDSNVDPNRTKVFFRGFSPMHFSSSQWNKPRGHKCNYETQPILNESYINPYPARMKLADEVVGQMRFPVSMINITRLSDFRKDAHPSVYTLRQNKKLTQEQRNNPDSFGDCSHWCLPGLPDIWNELLYGSIVMQSVAPSLYSH